MSRTTRIQRHIATTRAVRRSLTMTFLAACCLCGNAVRAQEEAPKKAPSPWMFLPTFSNNPKLGTSVGALAGYIRKFDAQSQLSMFGAGAQYTSTDSATACCSPEPRSVATSTAITAIAAGGLIKNDYDDFLGTGVP